MKYQFILLFLVLFLHARTQTIESYFDYSWKPCEPNEARFYSALTKTDSGYNRNDYFIREKILQMSGKYPDVDCKIPNGYFHYFHSNGILSSEGTYVDGKKNGLWLSFHSNGMVSDSTVYNAGKVTGTSLSWYLSGYIKDSTTLNEDESGVQITWFENGTLSSAGLYSAGKKQYGKWKYYHSNGMISSVELYDEGRLIDKQYFDEEAKVKTDTTNRDHSAEFPGGKSAWQEYILKKAYFPDQYKIVNGDKGVVVVSYAIDEDGKIVEVFVSTPFYPVLDRIAERVISHSPKWNPAISHNRRVKSWLRQPITFTQDR